MMEEILRHPIWGFPKSGVPFWGPENNDYGVLEPIRFGGTHILGN